MQKNGYQIWLRPGEKQISNGLTRKTQLSVQIRYYDETSPTKDREIEKGINPDTMMAQYFDTAVLDTMAKDILSKSIHESSLSSVYDKLPGHVRIIYSVKQKGTNECYSLDDLMTARVAFDARNVIDLDESKWDIAPQPIYHFNRKNNGLNAQDTSKESTHGTQKNYRRIQVASRRGNTGVIARVKEFCISHF